MKTGDLVKFPDSELLAMLVNVAVPMDSAKSVELWVLGDYSGPNPTYMSPYMLQRRAVVVSENTNESR